MKIGVFTPNSKEVKQIERPSQVHQLATKCPYVNVSNFLNCTIRVWNNFGQIVPPTALRDLAVLSGDEYSLQCGFDFSVGLIGIVLTYEICDEGSINKTVYVELDTTNYGYDVELDSIDITGTTAVKMRNYNLMNIVSPTHLPKNSVCIIKRTDILSLQKNNDLMGEAEISTHSNCILRDGTLAEVHPCVYDIINSSVIDNPLYTEIASGYVMGYNGINGHIIIQTGDDDFILHPVSTGCVVKFSQKTLTVLAQKVRTALIASHQANNVDSQEFASAVAAVGKAAEKDNVPAENAQSIANKVVPLLPSVRIARLSGVNNFNLASESTKEVGLKKTL